MKAKYIMRLDDAADKRDIEKWDRMETLLDQYYIRPLVGVIPKCEDVKMERYKADAKFWDKVKMWEEKGWALAMHGYTHVYDSTAGGIHPVNRYSEFAGHPLAVQKERIRHGIEILQEHQISPKYFFAPAQTFDENTLRALREETPIRIISDTVAGDVYQKDGFTFVPAQSCIVRRLPCRVVTFVYHPNTMGQADFLKLEQFIKKYREQFVDIAEVEGTIRKESVLDRHLRNIYFIIHAVRHAARNGTTVKRTV